jgi:hypothetical protein
MKRKILGTNKFVIYFYNGRNVRGNTTGMGTKPEHFVYKQWGRVFQIDEDGNQLGESYPFVNYGEMISFINEIMSRSVKRNLGGSHESRHSKK